MSDRVGDWPYMCVRLFGYTHLCNMMCLYARVSIGTRDICDRCADTPTIPFPLLPLLSFQEIYRRQRAAERKPGQREETEDETRARVEKVYDMQVDAYLNSFACALPTVCIYT